MNKTPKWTRFWNVREHSAGGFTLVELIVVIAILAILAGVAVPAYSGYIKKAEQAADEQLLAALNTAYAAACMENGEYDMRSLSFNPVATLNNGVVKMNEFDASFQNYFGTGNRFNHYDVLGFDGNEGVFKGNTMAVINAVLKEIWPDTSFADDPNAVAMLLGTFDGIGGIFELGAKAGVESFRDALLSKVSPEIASALGLTGMFNGVSSAMQLSDEEVNALLRERYPDFDEMDPVDQANLRAGVRGNAAVMYFANDTAGRDVDEVLGSVNAFTDALAVAGSAVTLDKSDFMHADNAAYRERLKAYYLSVATDDEKKTLENSSDPDSILYQFYAGVDSSGNANPPVKCGSDFALNGAQLLALSESSLGSNDTGITSLGAVYALAAGFYNSDQYTGGEEGKPTNYGEITSIYSAMATPNAAGTGSAFVDYCNSEQGKKDLEAYLAFMGSLSAGDVDLTDPNAFAGQNGYISGIVGGNK